MTTMDELDQAIDALESARREVQLKLLKRLDAAIDDITCTPSAMEGLANAWAIVRTGTPIASK